MMWHQPERQNHTEWERYGSKSEDERQVNTAYANYKNKRWNNNNNNNNFNYGKKAEQHKKCLWIK